MLLKEGDKLIVAHRRLFEKDEVRFFVGQVDAYQEGVVKVTGCSYVRDIMRGRMIEKAEKRTKVLSLSSGTLLVYQIPQTVVLDELKFMDEEGRLSLTDGKEFNMNLSEHTHGARA